MSAVSDALLKLETKLFNNTDTKRLYHRLIQVDHY